MKTNALALALTAFTLAFPAMAQAQPAAAAVPTPNAAATAITQKLDTIVLSLNFDDATINEAVYFLQVESRRLSADHEGINIIISPDASASARQVTLDGTNIKLEQALQTLCLAAAVKYVVEGRVVHILAFSEKAPDAASGLPIIDPNDKAAVATMSKLPNFVLAKINFQNMDIAAVLRYLELRSKLLDPAHQGIEFVLGDIKPTDKIHRVVSLTLFNMPFSDLLRYIQEQTNLRYSIGDHVVTFKP